jgi:methyl-accepting chemotaxis protein
MFSLTIKQKLFGLVGVIMLTSVIIAGVTYYGNHAREQARHEDDRVARIDRAMSEVQIGILQARRDEKDFQLRREEKYLDKHKKTMLHLNEQLALLKDNIRSADGLAAVNELIQLVGEYDAGFIKMSEAQIRVGLNEKLGLLGNLRNSVHNVEHILEQNHSDKLEVKMLMMRRHEKDFLARENDKYVKSMAQRKTEFEALLAKSPLTAAKKAQITDLMNSYHRDFNALVAGTFEVNDAVAAFREKVHATEPAIQKVEDLVQQVNAKNKELQIATDKRVNTILVITLILGGIVGYTTMIMVALYISRNLDKAVGIAKNVAEGKLGLDIQPESNDEIGQLMSSLKFMDENLVRVVSEVQSAVASIGNASQEIASGNTSLSQRTEEQASSLEETASSMEEMTGTVKQNADSAAEARQLADANRQKAANGAEIVAKTVAAMSEINESSSRIADIITTIDGIAFQTNLLALNAAVEAARAGEQGRGFAVVASEVRSLAQRSAEAAKEIKSLIEDSVGKVKVGATLVDESGKTLEEIISGIKKVADIIAEIAAASQEQASGIDQVNNAVTQMDNMTQDNAALVEEAAAASRALAEQSENLERLMGFFQLDNSLKLVQQRQAALGSDADWGHGDKEHSAASVAHQAATSRRTLSQRRAGKADSSEWEQF